MSCLKLPRAEAAALLHLCYAQLLQGPCSKFLQPCLQLSKEIDDYAAIVLKPVFKSKQLSKEGYKWVVKSTVEKVGRAALEQECLLAAVGGHCTLRLVGKQMAVQTTASRPPPPCPPSWGV